MKWILALLLGSLLAIPKSWAEDAQAPQDTAAYLEQLQVKLDHAAQRANQPSSEGSSVVGLRGSKQEAGSKQLYWKGRTGAVPVSTEEIKDFRAAVELARAGKNDAAAAGLKAFLANYPKSAFQSDAEESLKRIASVGAAPATVAAMPAPAAATPAIPALKP